MTLYWNIGLSYTVHVHGDVTGHWLILLVENSSRPKKCQSQWCDTHLQQTLSQDSSRTRALFTVYCTGLWEQTKARITRIVWLPYPIPVPMLGHVLENINIWKHIDIKMGFIDTSGVDQDLYYSIWCPCLEKLI